MKFQEAPASSPSLEKKKNIIERLDKQVQIIKSLLEDYYNLAHMDPEKLLHYIKEKKDQLTLSYTPELVTKIDHYRELSDTLDNTEEVSVREECYAKISSLMEDAEVNFAVSANFFFDRMLRIVGQNANSRKDPLYWHKMLTYYSSSGNAYSFEPEDVSRLDEDNFSTGIFIKYESWRRVMEDTKYMFADGVSARGTDTVYVVDSYFGGNKETLQHERVHHLLDEIPRYEIYDHATGIKNKRKQIRALLENGSPEYVIENKINNLLSDSSIRKYVNGMHNEFLAETNPIGSNSIKKIIGSENSMGAKGENSAGLSKQVTHLATAGQQIEEIFSALSSLPGALSDLGLDEAAQKAKNSVELFRNLFNTVVNEAEQAAVYGSLLGSEASTEVSSLFFILQPTNYRHIKTYLSTKYGEDFIFIEKHKRYLLEGRTSVSEFLVFMESVKQEKLTDSSREIIFRSIYNLLKGPLYFGKLGEESIIQLIESVSYVQAMMGDTSKNAVVDTVRWVLEQTFTMCVTTLEFNTKIISSIPAGSLKGLSKFSLSDLKESTIGGNEEKNKIKMDEFIELCREKGIQFIEDDLLPE